MRLYYVGGGGRTPPTSDFITASHPSSEGVKGRGPEVGISSPNNGKDPRRMQLLRGFTTWKE